MKCSERVSEYNLSNEQFHAADSAIDNKSPTPLGDVARLYQPIRNFEISVQCHDYTNQYNLMLANAMNIYLYYKLLTNIRSFNTSSKAKNVDEIENTGSVPPMYSYARWPPTRGQFI